ncbi:hypothetical protein D3C81_2082410 [compost metagenome]
MFAMIAAVGLNMLVIKLSSPANCGTPAVKVSRVTLSSYMSFHMLPMPPSEVTMRRP